MDVRRALAPDVCRPGGARRTWRCRCHVRRRLAHERRRIVALNQQVRTLGDGKSVIVHDYGRVFLGDGGVLSRELQPDFLHFSEKGYQLLAEAIRPDIEALLK